ncbi:unnamed protein product [Parascedosporium putredinis]|uniref:AAA+ ATPase domain-containing protein n=1 Tax=Parascedosporium putredinis TaxID=1442378 RepID=A0A9P1H831_9PEZI|nr:unnamed protein product [Parascedosporium putredinis]CAI7999334.1 unnamed protein product [Parascedosporium putredinis]
MGFVSKRADDMSEWAWKMRCKMMPTPEPIGRSIEEIDASSDDDPKTKPQEPETGVHAKVKYYYEGKDSNPGAELYNWADYPPKQMSPAAVKNFDMFAITVFKIKDRDKVALGNRFPLKTHKISVFNRQLIATLAPIVKEEGCHLDLNAHAEAAPHNDPVKPHLELLIKVLDDAFSDMRPKLASLKEARLINYRLAWAYFPTGCIIHTHTKNAEILAKVDGPASYTAEGMNLDAKVLEFNGDSFGWRKCPLQIRPFTGNKPIIDLPITPRMLDLQGLCYRSYNGLAVHINNGEVETHNVESRILVDVVGYKKFHDPQGKREINDPDVVKNAVTSGASEGLDGEKKHSRWLSEEDQARNKKEMLANEEQLMFMGPWIEGYALKNKMWVKFYVEDIEPITWHETAYDHLVYNEEQKDLVLSFVEHHGQKQASAFDDVIVGKGQGLILLLSGPPGTGKTLTAEAVADKTRRPLLYLQAEDLGINAASLGANLKRLLSMATDWKAVVLLDEADVFMATREPVDIARNELVSIFLRELEYFRGIVFLTTNLYHTIDPAFRSRVSLHLLFKSLSAEARASIWRKFLERVPDLRIGGAATLVETAQGKKWSSDDEETLADKGLSDDDIADLGGWNLNGREIKNAVKMVQSWCDYKGYAITRSKLENGIKVTTPHATKDSEVDTSLYD